MEEWNHWGINSNGTCYPLMNSYMGSYLCDPDNTYSKCASLPLFEVTTESIVSVPQNANKTNPKKIMIEEPLYLVGTTPPNPGQECRGDGKDPTTNAICDSFPMYLKIDYIRLYQDLGDDLEADTTCRLEWIEGHIDEYEDDDNKEETSDDCTIGGTLSKTALKTGNPLSGSSSAGLMSKTFGPPIGPQLPLLL
ncbi:hypothetical protein GQ600_8569 [Phytophthora cactorum]|nr:hypothetical protein GQ600_8569 [Phytophthora cactorum]